MAPLLLICALGCSESGNQDGADARLAGVSSPDDSGGSTDDDNCERGPYKGYRLNSELGCFDFVAFGCLDELGDNDGFDSEIKIVVDNDGVCWIIPGAYPREWELLEETAERDQSPCAPYYPNHPECDEDGTGGAP